MIGGKSEILMSKIETNSNAEIQDVGSSVLGEADELMKIFGAIVRKSEQ